MSVLKLSLRLRTDERDADIPDPENPAQTRWWDGTQWTAHTAPPPPTAVGTLPPPVPTRAAPTGARQMPPWAWVIIGILAAVAVALLAPLVALAALIVLITGVVALTKTRPRGCGSHHPSARRSGLQPQLWSL